MTREFTGDEKRDLFLAFSGLSVLIVFMGVKDTYQLWQIVPLLIVVGVVIYCILLGIDQFAKWVDENYFDSSLSGVARLIRL